MPMHYSSPAGSANSFARARRTVGAYCTAITFFLLTGCQSVTVVKPLAETLGGNEPEKQMEFWHQLAESSITSYDDAFHALLLFVDNQDAATDYAGRVNQLKSRGLIAQSFEQPGNVPVDRGTLAVALARALKIRGGVVMSVFGATPRYATKELEFLEVFPASSPNQTFSGSEFLAVISRAEDYQNTHAGKTQGGAGYRPPEMDLKERRPSPEPETRPAI